MATTTNYGWTTPDDTALVKDGASAIRSLGSAIDSTLKTQIDAQIPDSLVTTKGDIIAATAASTPARLASSAVNGEVLTVDTSTATGLKWSAISAWSPNLTLLNAGGTALTGAATITVNVSSYDYYLIRIAGASSANASSIFTLRFNGDTASNYGAIGIGTNNGGQSFIVGSDSQTSIRGAIMGNSAANTCNMYFTVLGGKNTGFKSVAFASTCTGSTSDESYSGLGYYSGTSAITSISIISSTGNFDAGTIYVYGG
jgi:hypothetical protein